jgi:aminoglycoside phosphotransferase (APT) family kinase protein
MSEAMNEAATLAVLTQACEAADLNVAGSRLLRLGSNAVYRLASPVVARIARPHGDPSQVRRTIAVARWLESAGYPAVRALPLDQPIIIDGYPVTFWEAVSDSGDEYATLAEVADVIAQLHKLSPPPDLDLPVIEPFGDAEQRIAKSQWLTPDDRAWMTTELARLRSEYARLDFTLPQGIIHGDANVGNVLHDYHGNPVMIDLDNFAFGPREWDLILTALYYDRFGWHTREEYETFVRVYGYDLMRWSGYTVLAAIREFIMVTWIILKAGESEPIAAEAHKRINALRAGGSRKDWRPFLYSQISSCGDPPEPRISCLRAELGDPPASIDRQMLGELAKIADAARRTDLLARRQCAQYGTACLLGVSRREMGICQHKRDEEFTSPEGHLGYSAQAAVRVTNRV